MTISYDQLMPGDLLLHASKGEVSKLIQWASNSDYSHVAMVFQPGQLAEAISSGVHFSNDLKTRIQCVPKNFHRIDAWRPVAVGEPIDAESLEALRRSALAMADRPFALNQWFELGLICAVRNKAPKNAVCKWLIALAIRDIVKVDPTRLLCSEFIYLSYFNAATVPAGKLKPIIARPARPNRPFPRDLDLLELIREYREAAGAGTSLASCVEMLNELTCLTPDEIESEWAGASADALQFLRSAWTGLLSDDHPDLIEPQDFAESPSFRALGSVVMA